MEQFTSSYDILVERFLSAWGPCSIVIFNLIERAVVCVFKSSRGAFQLSPLPHTQTKTPTIVKEKPEINVSCREDSRNSRYLL